MTLSNDIVDALFNKKRNKEFRKLKHISVNFQNSSIKRIDVNKHFWDHVIYHRNKRRRVNKEIVERLRYIKNSIKILKSTAYYQDKYTIENGSRKLHFIFLRAVLNDIGVGIVLRRIHNNNKYHLYSIIPNWNGYVPRINQINGKVTIHKN